MTDTPIFDEICQEFERKGIQYEDLARPSTFKVPVTGVKAVSKFCPPGAGLEKLRAFVEGAGHKFTDNNANIARNHPMAISARLDPDGSIAIIVSMDSLPSESIETHSNFTGAEVLTLAERLRNGEPIKYSHKTADDYEKE